MEGGFAAFLFLWPAVIPLQHFQRLPLVIPTQLISTLFFKERIIPFKDQKQ